MNIVFAGTPEFAARSLAALIAADHHLSLVLTQPDRPSGRGMRLNASPVKALALEHALAVAQPTSLKTVEAQHAIEAAAADVMVVAAYGLLLPPPVLVLPRLGCLNIHASLLPRWRGAAPIQRAILADDRETGITIMQMDAGLDTGAMMYKAPLPIAPDDSAQSLHDKLAALGAASIVTALALLEQGRLRPEAQDETQATYAVKLTKEEGRIDWRQDAERLARSVRAYNPFPVAHCQHDGEVWRVWRATAHAGGGLPGEILQADRQGILVACGEGALMLTEIQKAGGKRLQAAQFLAGHPLSAGDRLA
jgi:methionyl-tRNA formyltransferase